MEIDFEIFPQVEFKNGKNPGIHLDIKNVKRYQILILANLFLLSLQ